MSNFEACVDSMDLECFSVPTENVEIPSKDEGDCMKQVTIISNEDEANYSVIETTLPVVTTINDIETYGDNMQEKTGAVALVESENSVTSILGQLPTKSILNEFPKVKRGRPRKVKPNDDILSNGDNPAAHVNSKIIYQCELCEARFHKKRFLIDHFQRHTGEASLSCNICDFTCSAYSTLSYHKKRHEKTDVHPCKDCDKKFLLKVDLLQHSLNHLIENPLGCQQCGFRCVGEKEMKQHESMKHCILECTICNKNFNDKVALDKHILGLHGEKAKICCKHCHKVFTRKASLAVHMQKEHMELRLFPCDKCDKSFTKANNLAIHTNAIHGAIKAFKCLTCGVTFSTKCALGNHVKVHAKRKSFVCQVCESSFTRKASLVRHMIGHEGVKRYPCELCDFRFTRATSLKRHLIMHNQGPRLNCESCGYFCLWPSELRRHIKFVHSDVSKRKRKLRKQRLLTEVVKVTSDNNATFGSLKEQRSDKVKSPDEVIGIRFHSINSESDPLECNEVDEDDPSTCPFDDKKLNVEKVRSDVSRRKCKPKKQGLLTKLVKDLPVKNTAFGSLKEKEADIESPDEIIGIGNFGSIKSVSEPLECNEVDKDDLSTCPFDDKKSNVEKNQVNDDPSSSDELNYDIKMDYDITNVDDHGQGLDLEVTEDPDDGESHIHSCGLCEFTCFLPFELSEHLRTHQEQKEYTCDKCKTGFNYRQHWVTHMKTNHDVSDFPNTSSSKDRDEPSTSTSHQKSQRVIVAPKKRTLWCCVHCNNKIFKFRREYLQHLMRHYGVMPHCCEICNIRFGNHMTLRRHKKKVHGLG